MQTPSKKNRYQFDQSGAIHSVAFSPNGKTLACGIWLSSNSAGDEGGILKLKDTESGKVVWQRRDAHLSIIWSLDFRSDGRMIATGSSDNKVKLWDATTGKLIKTLAGHKNSVHSVCFAPDGKTLASGSGDRSVWIWNVDTGKTLHKLDAHSRVYAVVFSPDGQLLATAGADKTIRLWDVSTAKLLRSIPAHKHIVRCLEFSPDGRTLASGSGSEAGSAKLWNIEDGTEKQRFTPPDETRRPIAGVCSIAFSPNGTTVICASDNGFVRIWDAKSGRLVRELKKAGVDE